MKITHTVFKKTKLDSSLVKDIILGKLRKENHRILKEGNALINFDNSGIGLAPLIGATARIDEGLFEIIGDIEVEVKFSYSQSYGGNVLFALIMLLLAFVLSYYFLLFFSVAILVILIRIPLIKNEGQDFFDELLDIKSSAQI